MSSYSEACVSVTLIHPVKKSMPDDTIRILKNYSNNEFEVRYSDYNDGNPVTHVLTGMYMARMRAYLYTLLKNIYMDSDGYEEVQVDLPGLPRILVKASSFKELYYREHFLEVMVDGLDNLDNCDVLRKPKTRSRYEKSHGGQHLFFDEDEY